MGKESGLGAQFYLDGWDLSGDTMQVDKISKSLSPLPMTGIDKYAHERKAGILSGSIDFTSFFNPTNAHDALETMPRTDRVAMYLHKGNVLGTPAACMTTKQFGYDPTRDQAGSYTMKIQTLSNAWWLDWGSSLTIGKRSDTTATNGTGVDFLAAFNFGAQFYVEVFSFTGTSVTIKIQQSSDNGAGDAFADVTGGAFTVVSAAPTAERIQTARNQAMERYLRVVTTGTFSECTFAVAAVVNRTDMTI